MTATEALRRTTTVVDTVCGWLAELGCTDVFTVPGEAFLPLLASAPDHGLTVVGCRHESGAGFMALASTRLTGAPGVVAVNRAPGSCNVAIAIDAAACGRVPMLVIVGDIDHGSDPRTAFQPVDVESMFGPVATVIRLRPGAVHRQLGEARAALALNRPVVVSVAEDLWDATTRDDRRVESAPPARSAAAATARVSELLGSARRPVLVLGDQVRRSRADRDAHDAVAALAEQGRFPLLLANKQQDLLDNRNPAYAGHLHLGSPAAMRERLAEADLVVLLGAIPDEVCTTGWWGVPTVVVHPEAPFSTAEWWRVDSRAVLDALIGLDATHAEPNWVEGWHRQAEDWAAPTATYYTDGVDLAVVVAALDAQLTGPVTITLDAGNFSSWVHRYLRVGGERLLLGLENGAMGFGVPSAVAAARRDPERTVLAVVGDGGVLMTGQELATARRAGRCPIVLVADNGSYGTIHRHGVRRHPGRDCGTGLLNPDLVAWARAFGIPGESVNRDDDAEPAVRRALAAGRDGYLLHVRTSLLAGHANTVPPRGHS